MRKRKPKTPNREGMVLAVAWYSASEWKQLKEVVPDPERLEATYEEWESIANAALADLERGGAAPKRVPVGVEDLLDWCKKSGREPDGSARAQFAAEKLRKADRSEHGTK